MKKVVVIVVLILVHQTFVFGGGIGLKGGLALQSTNGLLIFLEDRRETYESGPLLVALAMMQKASPLIVSASILSRIFQTKTLEDGKKIRERLQALTQISPDKLTDAEREEMRHLGWDLAFQHNTAAAHEWIVKEINSSLYLLLHKSYLERKKISEKEVMGYDAQGFLTPVEMYLGLKVNHMRTVTFDDIAKTTPLVSATDYFISALKNNSLFVTNAEYAQGAFRAYRSAWAIFMAGHGDNSGDKDKIKVAELSRDAFIEFLSFLESKITTKLFYYATCMSGGKVESLIYRTNEEGVVKNYPFVIISQSLTDSIATVSTSLKNSYCDFLKEVTQSDCIDYKKLASYVTPGLSKNQPAEKLPKIKFPGLEWFSVIDEEKVVSIGSVLTKTRTAPLNVGEFLKRKGSKEKGPLAILLYTKDIPFELIIDSSGIDDSPPQIISMVPGPVLHTIKGISSHTYSTDSIVNSMASVFYGIPKVFVIGELTAPWPSYNTNNWSLPAGQIGSEQWVAVSGRGKQEGSHLFAFMFGDLLYKMVGGDSFPVPQINLQDSFSKGYLHQIKKAVQQQPTLLVEQAVKFFGQQKFFLGDCVSAITEFYFNIMPNYYVLHIPKLTLSEKVDDLELSVLGEALCKIEDGQGKQIHIDHIIVKNGDFEQDNGAFNFGVSEDGTKIFMKSPLFSREISCHRLPVPPQRTKVEREERVKIETKSIHTYSTLEAMKALAVTIANQKNRHEWMQKYLDRLLPESTWVKSAQGWIKARYDATEDWVSKLLEENLHVKRMRYE